MEQIDGEKHFPLAIMHQFVDNQGDAWAFTNAYLDRALDEERVLTTEPGPETGRHAVYLNRIRQVGKRVGEMHAALASRPDIAEFAPEPISEADLRQWIAALTANVIDVFERLSRRRDR